MGCGASTHGVGEVQPLVKVHAPAKELTLPDEALDASDSSPRKVVQGTPVGHSTVCVLAEAAPATAAPATGLAQMFEEPVSYSWMVYRVFAFLPWHVRLRDAVLLSRELHNVLSPTDSQAHYWRWLCDCLRQEAKLYLPTAEEGIRLLADSCQSFKGLFCDLWLLRHNFVEFDGEEHVTVGQPESIKLSTFCRLRPPAPVMLDGEFAADMLSAPVQLPLSQRVALLRQANPSLSHGAAMKLLLNKKCGAGDILPGDTESAPASSSNEAQDAQAAVAASAVGTGFNASVLSVSPGTSGSVLTVSPGIGIRKWVFDHVFSNTAKQHEVFDHCGLRLTVDFINGQSGSIIAYGQTGSGKTHTMFGRAGTGEDGLVSRVASEVLTAVDARQESGFEVTLGASYVEVFGNEVSNLLGGAIGVNRGNNQRMGHRYVLEGQFVEPVPDREAFADLLARGAERKRKASTAMNERSTRAHTILILQLRQRAPGEEKAVESMLVLVDLGGSEKVSKSKANELVRNPGAINVGDEEVSRVTWREYYQCRERITETNYINKGLLTLKRCVQALSERQEQARSGKELPRVPFHDSKLTLLLQPVLTGQARTSVIVCCSSEDRHAEESVQSLRFGEMCGSLENKRSGAEQDTQSAVAQAIGQLDAEIKEVEAVIRRKEKWEWRKAERVDLVDEKDTGGTVVHHTELMELGGAGAVEMLGDDGTSKKHEIKHEVWSQVLVGAEAENAHREELLKRRMKLLGGEA